LDLDEFETNAGLYRYPPEVRQKAQQALAELIAMIEKREFPFAPQSTSISPGVKV
jgi:protein associated with RNAse G/E